MKNKGYIKEVRKTMVMQILEFIFKDIWHFLGTWLLLDAIFGHPLVRIQSAKNNNVTAKDKHDE